MFMCPCVCGSMFMMLYSKEHVKHDTIPYFLNERKVKISDNVNKTF